MRSPTTTPTMTIDWSSDSFWEPVWWKHTHADSLLWNTENLFCWTPQTQPLQTLRAEFQPSFTSWSVLSLHVSLAGQLGYEIEDTSWLWWDVGDALQNRVAGKKPSDMTRFEAAEHGLDVNYKCLFVLLVFAPEGPASPLFCPFARLKGSKVLTLLPSVT